jgi:hypothetical protein
MRELVRRGSVIVVLVFASVGTASAECAWHAVPGGAAAA